MKKILLLPGESSSHSPSTLCLRSDLLSAYLHASSLSSAPPLYASLSHSSPLSSDLTSTSSLSPVSLPSALDVTSSENYQRKPGQMANLGPATLTCLDSRGSPGQRTPFAPPSGEELLLPQPPQQTSPMAGLGGSGKPLLRSPRAGSDGSRKASATATAMRPALPATEARETFATFGKGPLLQPPQTSPMGGLGGSSKPPRTSPRAGWGGLRKASTTATRPASPESEAREATTASWPVFSVPTVVPPLTVTAQTSSATTAKGTTQPLAAANVTALVRPTGVRRAVVPPAIHGWNALPHPGTAALASLVAAAALPAPSRGYWLLLRHPCLAPKTLHQCQCVLELFPFKGNPLIIRHGHVLSRTEGGNEGTSHERKFLVWVLVTTSEERESLVCGTKCVKQSSLKHLTLKTAFLVSLASGRRCSEVHALSGLPSDVAFEPNGSMSLRFLPDFLAKNQLPGSPSPVICIKSLSSIIAPDDEDRLLCPVRALQAYKKRTESFRSKQRRLLLSWNENYKDDIRRSTISRWLREVITASYARLRSELSVFSPKPHEIRAWASSLAFASNISLSSLMDAAYWRSPGTFIHF